MGMQILHGLTNRIAMQDLLTPISNCRHCRFYQPEGRRGGQCQQLSVTVQGAWQACALAASPFEVTAEEQAAITVARLETSVSVTSAAGDRTAGDRTTALSRAWSF